jgi:PHD/YefM family antitoxin component YafN of YafNO toxin-antitoxin module
MIRFELTEEEYNQFMQMQATLLLNSNPVLQKMMRQANAQQQQAETNGKVDVGTSEH